MQGSDWRGGFRFHGSGFKQGSEGSGFRLALQMRCFLYNAYIVYSVILYTGSAVANEMRLSRSTAARPPLCSSCHAVVIAEYPNAS